MKLILQIFSWVWFLAFICLGNISRHIWLFGVLRLKMTDNPQGQCCSLQNNISLQEAESCVRKLSIDLESRYNVVQCSYQAQFSAVNLRPCTFSRITAVNNILSKGGVLLFSGWCILFSQLQKTTLPNCAFIEHRFMETLSYNIIKYSFPIKKLKILHLIVPISSSY